MKLDLTDEQRMLCDAVAKVFHSESSAARVRAAEARGFDADLWGELQSMGIPSMRVAEPAGAGMSLFDAVLVAEEAGRHLASVPLAEAVPALRLLALLPGAGACRLLDAGLGGALVILMPLELHRDASQVVSALPGATVLALAGDAIVALTGLSEAGASSGAMEPNLGSEALTRQVLWGAGAAGRSEVLSDDAAARALFLAAREEWKILKAAMLAGLARRAIEMAAAYAGERRQFGKLIGSFQGIAHPLADALTDIDGARLLVWRAVWAIARGDAGAAAYVSMAWWWATQSSARAVARALHTFGGYGVSLEYDIQLYYRRAKAWALQNGDPQRELVAVADRLWNEGAATPLPPAGDVSVEFGVGAAAAAFGAEVRAFFESNLDAELIAHAHHSVAGYHRGFHMKLAAAGLLYPHWPAAFGGSGKTAFDMAAAAEAFEDYNWQRITVPVTNQVAQVVMRFGNPVLHQEVLPRLASGAAVACLGFTEPASGSDVFAAQTRAQRIAKDEAGADADGGDWLIDGQKVFTTAANVADYIFLLVRTDPTGPKHAGLTLFLVPMALPGVSIDAIHTLQDERTNITYLSGVRVPDRYRLGEVNGGLAVMAATLEIEHGGDQYRITFDRMVRHAVQWAQTTTREGGAGARLAIDEPDVRRRLARAMVHATLARDLCYRAIWAVEQGIAGRAAFGPMSKLFSTEIYQTEACDLMDLTAPASLFAGHDALGSIEIGYRQSVGMTIYGGSSEIHRSLIAEQGLRMPRSRT
ncbi:MAG: acyl-CoA dehydrogenase [Janthinobacterium lividum]